MNIALARNPGVSRRLRCRRQPTFFAGDTTFKGSWAAGGMGRVVRARDLKLGREVAIKLLNPGAHTERQRLRFEREARAAGALNHPNILAVHDIGEHGGEPFIVTELLEGETLRKRLSRGPLGPVRALALATQLADGLSAAHAAGIVHRDVKPENLFITKKGYLKILDFGITKLLEAAQAPAGLHTDTGAVMGTPAYMSPEQVQGEDATPRSDVFAFGAVLHEMLSGKGPSERRSAVESAYAILHEAPGPLPASTPEPLARLIVRSLEKDPALRPVDGSRRPPPRRRSHAHGRAAALLRGSRRDWSPPAAW